MKNPTKQLYYWTDQDKENIQTTTTTTTPSKMSKFQNESIQEQSHKLFKLHRVSEVRIH